MTGMLPLFSSPSEIARVVEEARREVRYVITDFSAELLSLKFKEIDHKTTSASDIDEGDIYIPSYQRELTWPEDNWSYFIESLILRFPIPPVFLYDVDGRLEVVDGSQRLRCINKFFKDEFALQGLEKIEILNGFRFSDLPSAIQRRIQNTPIRTFILDNSTDATTCVELFRRLNTTGERLTDAEIRKGAFRGPFLDLVIECADSTAFRNLTHSISDLKDPGGERQELVTRFFVYLQNYLEFKHDVRKFLDKKMIEYNKILSTIEIERLRIEFYSTMAFIFDNYRTAFYKTERGTKLARVRFEAVAVGTALALRKNPKLRVKSANWLKSKEFNRHARTEASNSAPKLRARIEFIRDNLLGT
mgnify:CR=1 FL=1